MRRWDRRRLIGIGIVLGAVVVASLVVLIALGVLVLPAQSSPTVTVSYVHWDLVEGTDAHGLGWFGPSAFNDTNGYPVTVAAGSTFEVVWQISNFNGSARTVVSVSANPPFAVEQTVPALSIVVPSGEDSAQVTLYVSVPDQAGTTMVLDLTATIH